MSLAKSAVLVVQKLNICKKCVLISFWIFEYCFYFSFTIFHCAIFYSSDAGFFQYHQGVKQLGSRSGPTLCRALSGTKLFAKAISRQQKSPLAGKELNTKQLVDTTFWLKLISYCSNFFSIWLKCWLQQILSQSKPCILKVDLKSFTLYLENKWIEFCQILYMH